MVNEILQLAQEGKAEDLAENLRLRCLRSLYFFAKVVLDYRELTEGFHLGFCTHVQGTISDRKRGYLAPRGHFKSTIGKAYALWRLLPTRPNDPPELRAIHNPNFRVLYVGESATVASKNLRDIKWHLQNNQLIRWLFPEIIPPDINKTKWTDQEILLPRERTYDESTITTMGVGEKGTGFHYDLIIYDDLIGEKAARSAAEMEAAWEWFQYAPGLHHDPANGEEILFGTRWKHGTADIYGRIMQELAHGTTESGRSTGFVWYVRSAVENNEPIFPERFSLEVLEEIRKREGDYKYNCQYLNNPTSPEGADFPPHWFKEFVVGPNGKEIVPCDGTSSTSIERLLRMSFYDPSPGGKTAEAESAIVIAGEASDRRIFVLDAWSANCSYGSAIEKWHLMNDQFQCYQNHYEQVGSQKAVETIIQERASQLVCRICAQTKEKPRPHRRLSPLPVKPDGRIKEDRIRAYAQAAFEEGRVYLRRGLVELRRQGVSFPHNDRVDQFDSLAYLIHLLRAPISDDEVRDERAEKAARDAHLVNRTQGERYYGGYA